MVAPEPLSAAAERRLWAPGVASATVALRSDEPCGDAAAWFGPLPGAADGDTLLAIVDGLGHGPEAALAAAAALRTLAAARRRAVVALPDLMQRLDVALASLRGAAVGLLRIQGHRLWHAGVGNTRALRLRGAQTVRLPSQNGIVGGGLPGEVTVTTLDLAVGDWLLLFTDGLDERLELPVQLPEWQRDPRLLCLHLLQHARLGRDDAGVLALRVGG